MITILSALRQEAGLTQKQFASSAEIPYPIYAKIEKGLLVASMDIQYKLTKYCSCAAKDTLFQSNGLAKAMPKILECVVKCR